jgi:Ca2+-binding EF-hand superfamily protein
MRFLLAVAVGAFATDLKHAEYVKDFNRYDLDGNKRIDPQEIRTVYGPGGDLTEADLHEFFSAVDLKNRGAFTLAEFIDYAIRHDKS